MSDAITNLLDTLANFQAQRAVLDLQKKELIDQVLTPEIKEKLVDIEAEFGIQVEAVNENIERITEQIKAEVLEHGSSVRGQFVQAVFSKGRPSWNTKALDGYAAAHPEILVFRKPGKPSVGIRNVGG